MNLSSYRTMDVNLLVGLVNTALRNDCENLEDLVKTHDMDREILEKRLAKGFYFYIEDQNQFRLGA